jgi:hypothetical protein
MVRDFILPGGTFFTPVDGVPFSTKEMQRDNMYRLFILDFIKTKLPV